MSPSTRSKPASQSSPETGSAPERSTDRAFVEVELEVSWQETAAWAAFQLIFGALLAWKLGTVGVWVGVLLLVRGAFRAYEVVQMLLHAPGTIVVSDDEVVLPRGLSMSKPVKVAPSEITAAYFLRRSVPWNRSAPVLVVELGDRAMAFPRDWFASEADQRHVIHALLDRIGPRDAGKQATDSTEEASEVDAKSVASAVVVSAPPAPAPERTHHESSTLGWLQAGVGLVLLAGGVGGGLVARSAGTGGDYALYVAATVTGFILCWRALTRW
jgi:hypothetical protein